MGLIATQLPGPQVTVAPLIIVG